MIIIAHRANLYGPNSKEENRISSILNCLNLGFDVEVDVWNINNKLFLGHDEPQEQIDIEFLMNNKLWCHAKNLESLQLMLDNNINCFWHENDKFTLTSKGIIWTYPNNKLTKKSVCVMPEIQSIEIEQLKEIHGICTDFCFDYKKRM
jgi:hypothetical protein